MLKMLKNTLNKLFFVICGAFVGLMVAAIISILSAAIGWVGIGIFKGEIASFEEFRQGVGLLFAMMGSICIIAGGILGGLYNE